MKKHRFKGTMIIEKDFSVDVICHNDDEAEEIAMDIVKENSSECFISDERTHIDFEEYDSVGITDKDAHYEAFEPDPYEDII